MVKKIIYLITSCFIFLNLGIFFYWKQLTKTSNIRDYIIVSVQGLVHYPGPLTFKKGIKILEIIYYFNVKDKAILNNIWLKKYNQWIKVRLSTKLYQDAVLKIND